jgi:tetratricopeptide (TPR) repeat protein
MSRYPEAEIFARELVAEAEKRTPICEIHVFAAQRLSMALKPQGKFEKARGLAHDGVERFRLVVPEGDAMVRLMEAESAALGELERFEEALVIAHYCLKTRTDHPERFPAEGEMRSGALFAVAHLLNRIGRLEEAEAILEKVLADFESNEINLQRSMLCVMNELGDVYLLRGRKKEAAAMRKKMKKLVPQVFPVDHPQYKMLMEQ